MTRMAISRWVRPWCWLPLLATGATLDSVQAQVTVGPFSTSEQNPLYRFFDVPNAEAADPIEEDAFRIDFSTSYSSVFEAGNRARHSHLFDLEQMTNSVGLRYGLSPSVELGARVGLYTAWGGFLDSFISGFHDLFGLPNAGRENRPDNEYLFFFEHQDLEGGEIDLGPDGRSFSLETVSAHAKWRFYGGSEHSRALSLWAAVRRAGGPLDEGRLDGAVALNGRASTESRFHFHGSLGMTLANPPAQLEPIAVDRALFFSTAAEYRLRPRFSLIGQISGSAKYLRRFDGGELDKVPLNLILGFGGLTDEGWRWQVSFAEDLIPSGPAIDFTLDLELSRTFMRNQEG